MNLVETQGKDPEESVETDYGMAVVVEIAFVLPHPVVHEAVIPVEIRRVIADSAHHPEEIYRVLTECIVHHLAVVEIFEDVGSCSIGIIIGIDRP